MSGPTPYGSRRGLQATLGAIGLVAVTAGLDGVLRGGRGVLHGGEVSANVDSELRFFAAWYAVLGGLALHAAREPEAEATIVQACGAGFLLGACGRLLSMARMGRPDRFFCVLLGLELAIPAVIVPWQRRLARSGRPTPPDQARVAHTA